VQIQGSRAPVGLNLIRYADKTYHNGLGNLCDNQIGMSRLPWNFSFNSGQLLGENFPGPVTAEQWVSNGQPKPLWDWCVPFTSDTVNG
jgi:hypothetical protein